MTDQIEAKNKILLEGHPGRKIKATKKNRIFTVQELCLLLGIEVPAQYAHIKDRYFTKTLLANELENKKRLIWNAKTRDDFGSAYYTRIEELATKFKEAYFFSSVFDHTDSELLRFFVRHLYSFRMHGFSCENFFSYELHHRTLAEADQFIGWSYRKKIEEACNKKEYRIYFSNKTLFNKTFKKHIKRDWLDARTCSFEEFCIFTERHPRFIAKPYSSTRGMGVRIIEHDKSVERLFLECQKENLIVEEIVENHRSIQEFCSTTLNTVRINTLITADGIPIVFAAGIRLGRENAVVDNHAAGGLIAVVDVETGVIISDGMDKTHTLYDKHPDSQKSIRGFQIPVWDSVIKMSLEAAELVPQIRLVGWDIAIKSDNTIELIEGNTSADLSMLQEPNQVGIRYQLMGYIDGILSLVDSANMNEEADESELLAESKKRPKKSSGALISLPNTNFPNRAQRCVIACSKPFIRLLAPAEYLIWLDYDPSGFFFSLKRKPYHLFVKFLSCFGPEPKKTNIKKEDVRRLAAIKKERKDQQKDKCDLETESISTGEYRYVITDNKVEITGYEGAGGELSIPEALGNNPVTSIGERAFFSNETITKVVIPNSVIALKKEAFSQCGNLTELIVNNGLQVIHSYCFAGCDSLNRIALPESLVTIYKGAFMDCISLKEIEIPEGITVLNPEVFHGCKELVCIGLPYYLERICSGAFRNCSSLQEFYHYSKRGISSVMVTDRNLKENEFPTRIQYIGNNAFENCSALVRIRIPHGVKVINNGAFLNCTSLQLVHTHSALEEIKDDAFCGCESLAEIKLPVFTKRIGSNVFNNSTSILCEKESYSSKYAIQNNLNCRHILETPPVLNSHMVPSKDECFLLDEHTPFYAEHDLQACIEKFEMRPPSYKARQRPRMAIEESVESSRFDYENGIYINKKRLFENRAVIMMAGDAMCRIKQQGVAFQSGKYVFDSSFQFIADILKQSDFAVTNLESMVSPSAPYAVEIEYVNDVPHLNTPESYLGAIRKASFDAVINAQNHVYDTGVRGLFETLDMQNKYQLMHTGVFTNREEKRYLMLDINGIHVAFLAYQDAARQQMKRANFSKVGKETLFNVLSTDSSGNKQLIQDIKNAKEEGAEFIIVFCHWGKEYTHEVSERQILFGKQVADAGADYVFGSHSHCVQPYDVITTEDNRQVPVFYSAGNLLSDINVNPPISRDTFIGELILKRDENGSVSIESEGYYPCRIVDFEESDINYAVVPTAFRFSEHSTINKRLAEAEKRIVNAIGNKIDKKVPQEAPSVINGKIKQNIYVSSTSDNETAEHNTEENQAKQFDIEHLAKLLKSPLIIRNSNTKLKKVTFVEKEADSSSIFIGLLWRTKGIDTNTHFEKVYSAGCRNFITEVDFEKEDINIIKVGKGFLALRLIASEHRKQYTTPLVAITGSVGKTSTKEMVYSVLSQQFNTLKNTGNFNTDQGVYKTLLELDQDHGVGVLEMSAYGKNSLARRMKITNPEVGIITSIGFSHIMLYKDQEELFETKMEIATCFQSNNLLIVNGDDDHLKRLKEKKLGYRLLTYGFNEDNDFVCRKYHFIDNSITFYVKSSTISEEFVIHTPAKHDIYNAMAAIIVGLHYNLSIDAIKKGLEEYSISKNRLRIKQIDNLRVIDDTYNASSSSMIAALDVLNTVCKGSRRVAVLGDILELGSYAEQQHRLVGANILNMTDILVTIGENAKYINEEAINHGFRKKNCYHFAAISDFNKASTQIINSNDTILLKASHGMKFIKILEYLEKNRIRLTECSYKHSKGNKK